MSIKEKAEKIIEKIDNEIKQEEKWGKENVKKLQELKETIRRNSK